MEGEGGERGDMISPFLSFECDIESLSLQELDIRFHDMLIGILQQVISPDVVLDA